MAPQHFAPILISGKTAGLVLAARLSENVSVSVLVLEAGEANLDDSLISTRRGLLPHSNSDESSLQCVPVNTVTLLVSPGTGGPSKRYASSRRLGSPFLVLFQARVCRLHKSSQTAKNVSGHGRSLSFGYVVPV